jgi:hypothetical protein
VGPSSWNNVSAVSRRLNDLVYMPNAIVLKRTRSKNHTGRNIHTSEYGIFSPVRFNICVLFLVIFTLCIGNRIFSFKFLWNEVWRSNINWYDLLTYCLECHKKDEWCCVLLNKSEVNPLFLWTLRIDSYLGWSFASVVFIVRLLQNRVYPRQVGENSCCLW